MSEDKPKLVIIAGPNGSGKTSLTSIILEHRWIDGCTYVNPDNIARDVFGDWNSPESVLKAAILSTEIRENCLEKKTGLLFETVLSSSEKVDYILRAKKAGYFVRLFFVGTDSPVINSGRIARRVMEGGHDVPINKIVSRFSRSIANCCKLASEVDRLYVYDNSIDFGEPKLLFRASEGIVQKKYRNINTWAISIFNQLSEK